MNCECVIVNRQNRKHSIITYKKYFENIEMFILKKKYVIEMS